MNTGRLIYRKSAHLICSFKKSYTKHSSSYRHKKSWDVLYLILKSIISSYATVSDHSETRLYTNYIKSTTSLLISRCWHKEKGYNSHSCIKYEISHDTLRYIVIQCTSLTGQLFSVLSFYAVHLQKLFKWMCLWELNTGIWFPRPLLMFLHSDLLMFLHSDLDSFFPPEIVQTNVMCFSTNKNKTLLVFYTSSFSLYIYLYSNYLANLN